MRYEMSDVDYRVLVMMNDHDVVSVNGCDYDFCFDDSLMTYDLFCRMMNSDDQSEGFEDIEKRRAHVCDKCNIRCHGNDQSDNGKNDEMNDDHACCHDAMMENVNDCVMNDDVSRCVSGDEMNDVRDRVHDDCLMCNVLVCVCQSPSCFLSSQVVANLRETEQRVSFPPVQRGID